MNWRISCLFWFFKILEEGGYIPKRSADSHQADRLERRQKANHAPTVGSRCIVTHCHRSLSKIRSNILWYLWLFAAPKDPTVTPSTSLRATKTAPKDPTVASTAYLLNSTWKSPLQLQMDSSDRDVHEPMGGTRTIPMQLRYQTMPEAYINYALSHYGPGTWEVPLLIPSSPLKMMNLCKDCRFWHYSTL